MKTEWQEVYDASGDAIYKRGGAKRSLRNAQRDRDNAIRAAKARGVEYKPQKIEKLDLYERSRYAEKHPEYKKRLDERAANKKAEQPVNWRERAAKTFRPGFTGADAKKLGKTAGRSTVGLLIGTGKGRSGPEYHNGSSSRSHVRAGSRADRVLSRVDSSFMRRANDKKSRKPFDPFGDMGGII